jgi:HAD superfamily hydrolase (TIGR01509 family)
MKVAIMDFDGTVFDSAPFWEKTLKDYLAERGVTPPPGLLGMTKTLGIPKTTRMFVERFGLAETPEEIMRDWHEVVRENYRYHIPLRGGALEYMRALKDRGLHVCMATANERPFLEPALERTGIAPLLEMVVTIGDVKADKNSPKIFMYCAEHFGARPDECVVFDDSYMTAEVCKKAGFRVIGVDDGVCTDDYEKMRPYCDKYIFSFSELLEEESLGLAF